ncbi:leucine rich repeat containing 4C precursor, partial [Silurus meridionalis]
VLFLVWGFFQSLGFVCSLTCVSAQDYVCDYIPNDYPPGLTSLVFFVRNVGEINSTIFNYTSLSSVTSLTMRQSGITAIAPGAFAQFQSLESLNLHSNDLSHITSDWFIHKEGLEKLILINNSIAALDGNSFAGLVKLSDLNLSHNQIHTITSDCFSFLPGLKHLDLSHNKLRHLSVDSFIPLNRTKIAVHGNPWDCSCTVYEFSLFLRELQTASLLPNEMEVLCMSPAHHRGRPVWNVSKCVNPTTDVVFTTGNSQNITPGGIHLSTVISLVVVLCALVLVICVLSVLYHRKQEQKHLLTIKPLPEEQEHASPGQGQAQPDFQAMSGISNRLESISCDHKMKQSNNRLLLKLDQTVPESQIYQIYSTRIFQTGEMSGRAKSAGPVLSRSDGSGKCPDTQMGGPGVWMVKDEEKHAGWTEKELEKLDDQKKELKEKECKHGSKGEEKQVGKTKLEKKYRHERLNNEFITTLKTGVGYEQSLELGEKDKYNLEGNVEGQGFLHTDDSVASEQEFGSVVDEYDLSSSLARSQAPQTHDDDFQALGDVENIPYFTIGADPKKQSPNPEQICTKASFEQLNLRPIRRTLSWPPTAAQWKKHLAQTQQVLNVSPEFIFVTQYHIGMLPSGMSSGVPENIPQAGCSRFPGQQLQIKDLVRFQLAETSMEIREFVKQSCNQDLPGVTRDYVNINEGQSEIIKTHVPVNSEAHSDLVTINPLCEEMSSEATEKTKMRSSKKKKTNQTPKGEQTRVIPGRKPKSGERDESKVLRDRQRDQSHSGSGAHPSGGSPSDDNLLVDNEYTFIDLLHEVVENHGRWTRERWRKSHINKQKIKQ